MIAASSRAEFSLKRLSFFPEPALINWLEARKSVFELHKGFIDYKMVIMAIPAVVAIPLACDTVESNY
jgi:hypothetical protein